MCGTRDGYFVTVFHTNKREPLERIARSFFARPWDELGGRDYKSLAVSRFLSASIASQLGQRAFGDGRNLVHHPRARITRGYSPMLADGTDFWMGFRFASEQAHSWARNSATNAEEVVCLYFTDTKHQFNTELPAQASVRSISQVDAALGGDCEDLIRCLLRQMELPTVSVPVYRIAEIVHGRKQIPPVSVSDPWRNRSARRAEAPLPVEGPIAVPARIWRSAERMDRRRTGTRLSEAQEVLCLQGTYWWIASVGH